PVNVHYLTGFTGEDSYLLITADTQILLSDSRFTAQLQEECPELDVESRTSATTIVDLVAQVIGRIGVSQLGFEADGLTVARQGQIAEKLSQTTLVPTQGWVERLRAVK